LYWQDSRVCNGTLLIAEAIGQEFEPRLEPLRIIPYQMCEKQFTSELFCLILTPFSSISSALILHIFSFSETALSEIVWQVVTPSVMHQVMYHGDPLESISNVAQADDANWTTMRHKSVICISKLMKL